MGKELKPGSAKGGELKIEDLGYETFTDQLISSGEVFVIWGKYDITLTMPKNPILDELVYDQSSGSLLYKGVRYLLIRPETIAEFQRTLTRSYGQEAGDRLFEGGYAGGSLSAKNYRDIHNFSDDEIIEFMIRMGTQIGWGHFSLDRYDPTAKHLCVSVTHSAFAQAYGPSTHGVCHLIRGVLAGMAAVLFGAACTARETECQARGDKCCRFVIEVSVEL